MRKLNSTSIGATALTLLIAAPARAATSGDHGENTPVNLDAPAQTAAHSGGSPVRALFGLLLVVALIYGLYWLLRRTRADGGAVRAKGAGLSTHATLPLGANRALHLVQAGDDVLLIGVAESQVVPLRTWQGDEAQELLGPPDPEPTPATASAGAPARGFERPSFNAWLDQMRARTVRR